MCTRSTGGNPIKKVMDWMDAIHKYKYKYNNTNKIYAQIQIQYTHKYNAQCRGQSNKEGDGLDGWAPGQFRAQSHAQNKEWAKYKYKYNTHTNTNYIAQIQYIHKYKFKQQ